MNVGTRLGQYQITGVIGAGGMGAVFRAHDARLGRDVAIKVLPEEVAGDPERLERFTREARATASLSHPNILGIFDIGTHEGVPYIVEALGLALAPAERASLRRVPTTNIEAHDFYLRAIQARSLARSRADVQEWITSAQAAVNRDPTFAEALALAAQGRLRRYWFYYDRSPAQVEQARVEAERAVALRPDAAEAHLALGYYHYYGRLDYQAALHEFDSALALEPSNAAAQAAVAFVDRRLGRLREAALALHKALDLNPRGADLWINLGETSLLLREYAASIDAFDRGIALNPWVGDEAGWRALSLLLWRGDREGAQRDLPADLASPSVRDDTGALFLFAIRSALIARDFDGAARRFAAEPRGVVDNQNWFVPKAQLRGELLLMQGRRAEARAEFAAALEVAKARLVDDPEDARSHSAAGIVLAGLGRREEAIREAEEAVRLMPPAKDAFRGPSRVEDLALVYTMTDEDDKAVAQLEWLLSNPSYMSARLLEIEPRWDPLRSYPGFKALLARYRPAP